MKKLMFCAIVAVCCSGTSALHAQMRMLDGTPTPAPRLVAAQSGLDGGFPVVPEPEIANPFELLGNIPAEQPPAPPSPTDLTVPDIPSAPTEAVSEDPQSLPVGRRHRHNRGVVDTMANYGSVASVPHAAQAQVDWCYGAPRTPNPVAQVLLRQECVEGLWDGYSAQRAAECAHMWSKLTATKKCRGCNHCSGGKCDASCTSGCTSCAAPVNRYTEGCDTCTSCAGH